MDRRAFLPLVAAVLIAGVCVWRVQTNRPQDYADQVAAAITSAPAPLFELLDAKNHLVRLGTFVGRHPILLVFFDGEAGADRDADLIKLRNRAADLESQGVKVIAISSAIPQQNRQAMERGGEFPFPLVSDFDPRDAAGQLRVHAVYGRLTTDGKPRPGLIVIDRKGQLQHHAGLPMAQPDLETALRLVLK